MIARTYFKINWIFFFCMTCFWPRCDSEDDPWRCWLAKKKNIYSDHYNISDFCISHFKMYTPNPPLFLWTVNIVSLRLHLLRYTSNSKQLICWTSWYDKVNCFESYNQNAYGESVIKENGICSRCLDSHEIYLNQVLVSTY